jgi:FkbM family methyltransferase
MLHSLSHLFEEVPDVKVVDVGASPLGTPIWTRLVEHDKADVIAFEPDEIQFMGLSAGANPRVTPIQAALGDGEEHDLHLCQLPGLTSLLKPRMDVLRHFHGFEEWAKVLRTERVATRRLDDVAEAEGCHFLKIDVQGAELSILQHATELLRSCLVVQLEAQFVPFYEDQPLFGELDLAMREAGFWLHRFEPLQSRVFKPLILHDDIYAGLSQILWTDAIYVRRFTDFGELEVDDLLRIALIAHDVYESLDLASLALLEVDRRDGGTRQPDYIEALTQGAG